MITGGQNNLLKKLLKLVSSQQENLQFIATDLAKKGLSIRKLSENEYEILYKGTSIFAGKDSEVAGFLKKYFWKSLKKADEELGAIELLKRTGKRFPEKIITGTYSKRTFDVNNCGGKILNLSWKNAKITKKGIEIVKKHLSRFEEVPANSKMIKRLEDIETGKISITDFDKRFYTHEMREYERYKNLGVKDGVQTDYNTYNDLHTATLEDFKLIEIDDLGNENLYHPIVNPEDFHF